MTSLSVKHILVVNMDAMIRDYLRALGKKGGPARAKALTKAQRRAIAKRAAAARWAVRPTPRAAKV